MLTIMTMTDNDYDDRHIMTMIVTTILTKIVTTIMTMIVTKIVTMIVTKRR